MQLASNGHTSPLDVCDGTHDVRVTHVATRIVVLANRQDAGVCLIGLMESSKVVCIASDYDKLMLLGVAIVKRIRCTADACIGRSHHFVPGYAKHVDKLPGARAIIEINLEAQGRILAP